jgi:hypothetical protein
MIRRHLVQKQHERAIVAAFLEYLNRRRRTNFVVIDEPDPPDAIIQSPRRICWIEVGSVYWNDEWARDLFSYATPREVHKPVESGPYYEMDSLFAERFVAVLRKKLANRCYTQWSHRYGPGYLVLPMLSPFFNKSTIHFMKDLWTSTANIKNLDCFGEIYLVSSNAGQSRCWKWHV